MSRNQYLDTDDCSFLMYFLLKRGYNKICYALAFITEYYSYLVYVPAGIVTVIVFVWLL